MSKQYLTLHTLDDVHPTDILSLSATRTYLLSASGSSSLRVHSITLPDFPLLQTLEGAHKLGAHHVAASRNGKRAASVGFGGELRIWDGISQAAEEAANQPTQAQCGPLADAGTIVAESKKAGEIWAISLSEDGRYLAATAYDGRISMWDLDAQDWPKVREYETKGSFGLAVDLSLDGRFVASGHENGGVYIFNNDTGRMMHSCQGLVKPVRAVKFSPATKLLAAAGDARVIALYDVSSGEQVGNLSGHAGWILSLSWNETGEYLLSGSHDGRAKVWSTETRNCVATHTEASDTALWAVTWLPRTGRSEMFTVAGANKSISVYREATGG